MKKPLQKNDIVKLMDLNTGDRFYVKSDKKKIVHEFVDVNNGVHFVKTDIMLNPVTMKFNTTVVFLRSTK